jgi:hypothetical protein
VINKRVAVFGFGFFLVIFAAGLIFKRLEKVSSSGEVSERIIVLKALNL